MFLEHLEGIQSLVKKQHNGPWLMTLIDFMMLTVLLLSFLLQGTICTFMQFPSGITERVVTDMTDLTDYAVGVKLRTQISSGDVDVLKKLAAVSSQLNVGKVGDKVVSASNFYFIIQFHSFSLSHTFISMELTFDKFFVLIAEVPL